MDIAIEIIGSDPPTGQVRADQLSWTFRSWLELLQILAELLPPPGGHA